MTIRALLAGCWFAHSKETHWVEGALKCMRCWEPIPILVKGTPVPKGEPAVVRGVPSIKARKVRRDNVTEFPERQSSR